MKNSFWLSRREKEVAGLLLEGRSNKQIGLALHITESTVEFHLKNIYTKLGVESRVEAIIKLRETTGIPGDSTVADTGKVNIIVINKDELDPGNEKRLTVTRRISLEEMIRFLVTYRFPIFIWMLLVLVIVFMFVWPPQREWRYAREGEYPDEYTVGQVIQRSNASDEMVHGQFGTVPAWPPQPGYVLYQNIKIPKTDHLFLKLRYSKYSPSTVRILVFLDDEPSPRQAILPVDQGSWDTFVWTEAIDLRSVERGVHSIKFYTDGQTYGVADLDQFELKAGSP